MNRRPVQTEVPQTQPDFTLVRRTRIEKMLKGLEKANAEEKFGTVKWLKKEIEIQLAYLELES